MDQEKIGKFIKKIREDNNLTQKDLANQLGVTYQAVSKWENGKNVPDIGILKLISEEYDVNIDEILKGEKVPRKKKTIIDRFLELIPSCSIVLGIFIALLITRSQDDFNFKTLSSKCSDFKITGSAAYNKEKTSIYISNIEFCGKEDKVEYKKIECSLYEKENQTKTEISTCPIKENITLESFLKDTNIKVDKYSTVCKNLNSNTLFLKIHATTQEDKVVTYTIPLELNENCQ